MAGNTGQCGLGVHKSIYFHVAVRTPPKPNPKLSLSIFYEDSTGRPHSVPVTRSACSTRSTRSQTPPSPGPRRKPRDRMRFRFLSARASAHPRACPAACWAPGPPLASRPDFFPGHPGERAHPSVPLGPGEVYNFLKCLIIFSSYFQAPRIPPSPRRDTPDPGWVSPDVNPRALIRSLFPTDHYLSGTPETFAFLGKQIDGLRRVCGGGEGFESGVKTRNSIFHKKPTYATNRLFTLFFPPYRILFVQRYLVVYR